MHANTLTVTPEAFADWHRAIAAFPLALHCMAAPAQVGIFNQPRIGGSSL
jgi:hypothetical protein